jgi:hypothetical protein
MSNKYKIINCPAFVLMRTATSGTYFDMCGNAKGHIKCADCTDCRLKQIVEKCKNYKEDCKIKGNCLDERLCSTCFLGGANELGEWILDDLDIQEVE